MFKSYVIARQTLAAYTRDRIFHSTLIFSVGIVLFSVFLSSLTIVESRKILLDFGLAAISLLGVVLSIYLGVTAVGKEIERNTVYTILSKPIDRFEYLGGKFLGVSAVLALVHLVNAATLWLVLISMGEKAPAGYVPANYLMLLESILVMGLALFSSLCFSSLFLSASVAGAGFFVGRSSYSIQLLGKNSESLLVKWITRGLYDLIPNLDRFNIREVVAYSKEYPDQILPVSSLYFAVYILLLFALSVIRFRKKDLI